MCSHTCELFRRGLAVQPEHFPPAPAPQLVEGGALDALVEVGGWLDGFSNEWRC